MDARVEDLMESYDTLREEVRVICIEYPTGPIPKDKKKIVMDNLEKMNYLILLYEDTFVKPFPFKHDYLKEESVDRIKAIRKASKKGIYLSFLEDKVIRL